VNDIDLEAQRLIAEALYGPSAAGRTPNATNYRSDTPTPAYGPTPPVQLPPRAAPDWAVGTAVAAVGIGLGSLGIGAAINLAVSGFSNLTATGVIGMATVPAGVAVAAATIGKGIAKARAAAPATPREVHNTYTGQVIRRTDVHVTGKGLFSRPTNQING